MKKFALIVMAFVLVTACNKSDDSVDYIQKNDDDIVAYIDENNLDAEKSASGLYYVIDEPGSGEQPTAISNVTVAYKGYFLNYLFKNRIIFGILAKIKILHYGNKLL